MGFLKKLFGGKKEDEVARSAPPPRTPAPAKRPTPEEAAATALPPVEEMNNKQLIRVLGSGNREMREQAATRLKDMDERAAVRPLINSYLNYGDPAALDALATYGSLATMAATNEAFDVSVVGDRRARLMDILGVTGDTAAIGAVRECVDYPDKEIHVRACLALARLGDLNGISILSGNLQDGQDEELRTKALAALGDLSGEVEGADRAIQNHVARYLAEGGAIPDAIEVKAPRLADPDTPMTAYIVNEIKETERDLVVVTGSGAIDIARTRQADLRDALSGHDLQINTPQLAPEEQMDALEKARDTASADPEHTVLVIGSLPAPSDSPPLRHFLVPSHGGAYTAKLIYCDPHEYTLLQDWWHYIEDRAEVDTAFEIVLSVSTPERSAISEEEYLIYNLTPEDQRDVFPRALLAHL